MAGQGATAKQINDKIVFVGKLYEVEISGFATIARTDFKPTRIGTVKWSWKDEEEDNESLYMEHQAELENANYSNMTQNDLPEDSQFPWVNFGAAIVPVHEYSSDEEEDNESIYMEHQAEPENDKPKPDGVDASPTALMDTE